MGAPPWSVHVCSSTFVFESLRLSRTAPTFGIMSLVVLGVVRRAGGVSAMAAFVGGRAKLWVMCRPMEVHGGVAVMADAVVAAQRTPCEVEVVGARWTLLAA